MILKYLPDHITLSSKYCKSFSQLSGPPRSGPVFLSDFLSQWFRLHQLHWPQTQQAGSHLRAFARLSTLFLSLSLWFPLGSLPHFFGFCLNVILSERSSMTTPHLPSWNRTLILLPCFIFLHGSYYHDMLYIHFLMYCSTHNAMKNRNFVFLANWTVCFCFVLF